MIIVVNCYRCGQEIFFNEEFKGKRGRLIPLQKHKTTGKYYKHNCPYKVTRKQYAREKSFYGHVGIPFVRIEE